MLPAAALLLAACGSHAARSPAPAARHNAPIIDQGTPIALAPDSLPSCFAQDEPPAPPAGEKVESFPPARPGATPAPAASTLDLSALAQRAPFGLYALNEPARVFSPVALRRATVPDGGARTVVQFMLQYRQPPKAGGGIVSLISQPAAGAAPQRTDLDDSLDAVRLGARLKPNGGTGDPLADPTAALAALGCPTDAQVQVSIEGKPTQADLLSWAGAADVLRLRLVVGKTEVSVETAGLARAAAVALVPSLTPLAGAPQLRAVLQKTFAPRAAAQTPAPQP